MGYKLSGKQVTEYNIINVYQNKCPQLPTTGSLATSKQTLHSDQPATGVSVFSSLCSSVVDASGLLVLVVACISVPYFHCHNEFRAKI